MASSERTIEQRRRRITRLGGLFAAVVLSIGNATGPAMYVQYFCQSDYMVKAEVVKATLKPRRRSITETRPDNTTVVCPECELDPVEIKVRVTDVLAASARSEKIPADARLQKGKEVNLVAYLYNSIYPWPIEMGGNILIAGARAAPESQRNVSWVFDSHSFIFVVQFGHDLTHSPNTPALAEPYRTDTWMPESESQLRALMTTTGCGLRPTS